MLGSRCCCNCPGIVPYRFNSATQQYEDYDIPEEVEVDVSFQLPQDELWIETRKDCCSAYPNLSFGRKYKRPSSGTYSLVRVNGYRYEYISRDLILRVDLSSQYLLDTSSPIYTCSPWARMLISFGTHAEISREGSEFDPVSPVTDAELTAALSRNPQAWNPGSYTDVEFTRYCRKSTPNIVSGGCQVGEWNELYQTPWYPSGIQPDQGFLSNLHSVRLPQSTTVPFTVDVQVPAIDVTPEQLGNYVQLSDLGIRPLGATTCWFIGPPSNPCYEIFDPEDPNYVGYAQTGTRLVSRVLQVNGAGKKSLPGTLTINSVKAKRTGAPDINVLDMPEV